MGGGGRRGVGPVTTALHVSPILLPSVPTLFALAWGAPFAANLVEGTQGVCTGGRAVAVDA